MDLLHWPASCSNKLKKLRVQNFEISTLNVPLLNYNLIESFERLAANSSLAGRPGTDFTIDDCATPDLRSGQIATEVAIEPPIADHNERPQRNDRYRSGGQLGELAVGQIDAKI